MTENGDPNENAIAESINGILKHEFRLDQLFQTMTEMKAHVTTCINSYKERRHHASCDFLTLNQAHKGSGILIKRWKRIMLRRAWMNQNFKNLLVKKYEYIFCTGQRGPVL